MSAIDITMALQNIKDEEGGRLIQSLLECVNSPLPRTVDAANKPFQWALDLSRARLKPLRRRVTFHADDPSEQSKNLSLAQRARSTARGILWWLATTNDAALDEPVLFARVGTPRISWAGLTFDAPLLEAPIEYRYFAVEGDTVILKIADQVKIRVARSAITQVEASEDAK